MHVKINDEILSEKIPILRGVRQSYKKSPKLFILALENIFKELHSTEKVNIDGKFLRHLRFADDIVVISTDADELEQMMAVLDIAAKKVGLNLNLNKIKIMSNSDKQFGIEQQSVETVEEYIYLGNIIKLGKENQTAELTRRVR